jgi:hypothetical protein
MSTNINLRADLAKNSNSKLPVCIWIGGVTVRVLFLIVMTVVAARVASPQLEHIWSVYETPSDFVRVVLGFMLCVWLMANVFMLPKDVEAYRTWLYLGPAILPLSLICAVVAW